MKQRLNVFIYDLNDVEYMMIADIISSLNCNSFYITKKSADSLIAYHKTLPKVIIADADTFTECPENICLVDSWTALPVKPLIIFLTCYDKESISGKSPSDHIRFVKRPFSEEVFQGLFTAYSELIERAAQSISLPKTDRTITSIIRKIGIPIHTKGYRYLRYAVAMAANDPTLLDSITKRLYPEVALANNTTAARVERAIRNSITIAWDKCGGDVKYITDHFDFGNYKMRSKPTNSEMIAMICDYVKYGRCDDDMLDIY